MASVREVARLACDTVLSREDYVWSFEWLRKSKKRDLTEGDLKEAVQCAVQDYVGCNELLWGDFLFSIFRKHIRRATAAKAQEEFEEWLKKQ